MNPKVIMLGEGNPTKRIIFTNECMMPLYEIPKNGARGRISNRLQRGTRKVSEVMEMYLS